MFTERVYSAAEVSAQQVNDEVALIWERMASDEATRVELGELGIRTDLIDGARLSEFLVISPRGEGLDPASTAIVVGFAVKIAGDVWDRFVLPRLEQRFGVGCLPPAE